MPRKAIKVNHDQKGRVSNGVLPDNADVSPTACKGTKLYALSIAQQQAVLDIFHTAFPIFHDGPNIQDIIQTVKRHLYARDFEAAFSQESYLHAYALRWSAARALGYTHILTNPSRNYLFRPSERTASAAFDVDSEQSSKENNADVSQTPSLGLESSQTSNVLCIGGGAGAEIVAFAAAFRTIPLRRSLRISIVDCADWSATVEKLASLLTTTSSSFAAVNETVGAKAENMSPLSDFSTVEVSFTRQDVLSWESSTLNQAFENVTMCTMMFTLNELFSTSLSQTTSLLLRITDAMPRAGWLLVVDSPGSYSEIQVGKDKLTGNDTAKSSKSAKRYPMKWLLDHTLLEVARNDGKPVWEKVESEDSLWFRINQEERKRLRYPLELENMRYQLHIYRRR